FGMASPVTAAIIQMGVPEIDRIAVEKGRHLKARWPESRSFWKGLLRAAIGTDDQALANAPSPLSPTPWKCGRAAVTKAVESRRLPDQKLPAGEGTHCRRFLSRSP